MWWIPNMHAPCRLLVCMRSSWTTLCQPLPDCWTPPLCRWPALEGLHMSMSSRLSRVQWCCLVQVSLTSGQVTVVVVSTSTYLSLDPDGRTWPRWLYGHHWLSHNQLPPSLSVFHNPLCLKSPVLSTLCCCLPTASFVFPFNLLPSWCFARWSLQGWMIERHVHTALASISSL